MIGKEQKVCSRRERPIRMSDKYNSVQEQFWAGNFGEGYISRNQSEKLVASNVHFFSKVLKSTDICPISVLELGANIGMNVQALKKLIPKLEFTGIEINAAACDELKKTGAVVLESSILDAKITESYDLVFSKGVLIHLNPDQLLEVYSRMVNWSSKYILIAEYYNPSPVEIPYRGHSDRLYKRDFAGEMLDLYPNVTLRDYGFVYHRDVFPQDDISWFLLEKVNR